MLSDARRGSGVRFNRRDSKSREPLWLRGFESPPLRHSKCLIYLHCRPTNYYWGRFGGRFATLSALDRFLQQGTDSPACANLQPRNPSPIVAEDHLFRGSAYLSDPPGVFPLRERERNKRVANAILPSLTDSCAAQRGFPDMVVEPFLIEWSAALIGKNEVLRGS